MAKIAFKSDNQGQIQLLPPSLDELIPATHPVRVLNSIVDRLDVSQVLASYKGGGNSCFHPRMKNRASTSGTPPLHVVIGRSTSGLPYDKLFPW